MNFGEVRRAKLAKSTHLASMLVSLGSFFRSFKSVQMLKTEWGKESNRNPSHLFIPSKTATLVPQFAVEGLPLNATAELIMMKIYKCCTLVNKAMLEIYRV